MAEKCDKIFFSTEPPVFLDEMGRYSMNLAFWSMKYGDFFGDLGAG
jgi:hypothetical protein